MLVYSSIMVKSHRSFRIHGLRLCAIAMVALIGLSTSACGNRLSENDQGLAGSVSITGIPRVGETLGVNIRNLDGSGSVFFQWMADGQPFANNRGATLRLDTPHANRTITVTVTTSDNYGGVTSLPVGPVIATNGILPTLTGSVGITGIPRVGQTLRANIDYLGGSGVVSYEWKIDGIPFENNRGMILPLDILHRDRGISVTVRRESSSGSVTSESIGPVGDGAVSTLTGSISITGSPHVGQTLRANVNSLGGSGEIFYEWMVGDETVGTGGTLFLIPSDAGQAITVTVMRKNNSGSVTSPSVGPVTQKPMLTGTVGITGTPHVGQTLRVNTASLGGSGAISFEWRVGDTIAGTGNTLPLVDAHAGQMVIVTVTRADNSGSITSQSVGPVTTATLPPPPPPPPPPASITITVTGIPGRYIGHWGGIDLESNWAGHPYWVAESNWLRITGSSATFTMRTLGGAPFSVPGTYRIHFSVDDDAGPVGDYSVIRSISAGNNPIPFIAFTPVFSSFSENLESTGEEMPPGGSRARTRHER